MTEQPESEETENNRTLLGRAVEEERKRLEETIEGFSKFDVSVLDEELAKRSVSQYEDGHYQSAVRTAFLILEERVQDKGGFSADDTGANLMTDAFHPDRGPLAFGETKSEKQGAMFLFRGAIQSLRNPASHRTLEEADEEYARDVIHTVNLLLRLLEINNSESSDPILQQVPETGAVTNQEEQNE